MLFAELDLDAELLDEATTLQAELNAALGDLAVEEGELADVQAAVNLVASGDVDAILNSDLDIEGLLDIDLSALAGGHRRSPGGG